MLQGSTAAASAATIQQAAEASLQELGPLIEKAERDGNVSKVNPQQPSLSRAHE